MLTIQKEKETLNLDYLTISPSIAERCHSPTALSYSEIFDPLNFLSRLNTFKYMYRIYTNSMPPQFRTHFCLICFITCGELGWKRETKGWDGRSVFSQFFVNNLSSLFFWASSGGGYFLFEVIFFVIVWPLTSEFMFSLGVKNGGAFCLKAFDLSDQRQTLVLFSESSPVPNKKGMIQQSSSSIVLTQSNDLCPFSFVLLYSTFLPSVPL